MRNSINIFLYLDFLGKCTIVVFILSREKVTVEPGTAISVSARSCRLFDVNGIACFFLEELNISKLHYPLKMISL